MRIIHLSSVHLTKDVRIFEKECRTLADAGYNVTLVAHGDDDGEQDGVRIRALRPVTHGRLARMTSSVRDTLWIGLQERGDLYHLHDPELLPVGVILKLLGKKVIFDAHEHVAKDVQTKPWIPAIMRRPVSRAYSLFERVCTYWFDGIVAATPGVAEAYPGRTVTVVQNFPLLSELGDGREAPATQSELAVAYVGSITALRGARVMLEAVEAANRHRPVTLHMAGTCYPSSLCAELVSHSGYPHIVMHGQVGRLQVANVLARSRAGLILFQPAPNHMDAQPNKLFEYMAAGLPVIASDFPYWRGFVEDLGTGVMVDPTNPEAIAAAIVWILEHPEEARTMGCRGREAVKQKFSWEAEGRKLVELYHDVVGPAEASWVRGNLGSRRSSAT